VVIKSSGHDYLGRSTARHSLLLWTAYFKDIAFTDNFLVDGVDQGPAVTVGAGVGLLSLYNAAGAQNKIFVGGAAVTVSLAGGYLQGAGHSPFSPIYGLAADNVLRTYFPVSFSHSDKMLKNDNNNRVQGCSGRRFLRCGQFGFLF
jgi:FAD/FMN-containing dehydrogenase